ncbi:hypothetical protein [Microvirga soli]|jgi:hypothetical protein|uniref:hypothetical protein n=1 Tax=Microvirga soli TaxID=1854496 RepID=UPI00191F526E|nr:hypothetical protein [Microvirga soli]
MTSDMLEAELEMHLARPLPPEPPFEVMANVTALQDRVYAMAPQSWDYESGDPRQDPAADFSPHDEKLKL